MELFEGFARRALEPQVTSGISRFLQKDLRVALWSAVTLSPLWYRSN